MKPLSIVIPVFNKSELTDRCLDSLLRHSKMKNQLTIIDNNSTDNTPDILAKWKTSFEQAGWSYSVITNPKNVGFGSAMNQGARVSEGNCLALLNNDTWLLPDWDAKLLKVMSEHQDLDLAFPFINEDKPFSEQHLLTKGLSFEKRNSGRMRKAFTGVLMFFRRSSFEKLGGFDERFFVTYEDTDLRVRMDRNGMKYRMVGDCLIWHQSMATRSGKNMPANYELESKAKFIEKWGFDYSATEKTFAAKWQRKWVRLVNRFGYL